MKKLMKVIVLLIIFAGVFSKSSNALVISGYIYSQSNGYGIPNKTVFIKSNYDSLTGLGINYNASVSTNNQGYFKDSISTPGGQIIKFTIWVYDCNNQVQQQVIYASNNTSLQFTICNNSTNSCLAAFYAYNDTASSTLVHFINNSSQNSNYIKWKFGDGDSSLNANPTHQFPTTGKFKTCIYIKDTLTNCYSQFCDSIRVGIQQPCQSNFSISVNGYNVIFNAENQSDLPVNYKWTFGDGGVGNGKIVTHIFSGPGTYHVVLKTYAIHPQSKDTCYYSLLKNVVIEPMTSAGLFGQVFKENDRVDYATVWLYKLNTLNQKYTQVASTNVVVDTSINSSYYFFPNVAYGTYIVKAMLKNNSNYFYQYAPAYNENTIYWNGATAFDHHSQGINHSIRLKAITPISGPHSISGHVYQGYSKNPGDPISNVLLYLLDNQGKVRGYTYTNFQGYYSFAGVAQGNYKIYADVINKTIFPCNITLTIGNINVSNINIYINSNSVTAIEENQSFSTKIYPNPANNLVNLVINSNEVGSVQVQITNLIGQEIFQKEINLDGYETTEQLDLSTFETGMYLFSVKQNEVVIFNQKLSILR